MNSATESPVIVRLMGGLGNQLFQFATGYALAERLHAPLLLDRSHLDHRSPAMSWTPRDFELDAFRAPFRFASAELVREARASIHSRVRAWLARLLHGTGRWQVLQEHGSAYHPELEGITGPIYLEGYWQNERYFASIADALRGELLLPRDPIGPANADLLSAIRGCVSASLHVRLGDYRTVGPVAAKHGVLDPAWQRAWAQELVEAHGVEHFFVFSDEPERMREHLQLPWPHTVIAHNTGKAAHWDLYLMRHCDHHIIANSSFSWWGAWLNPSPTKTVIAPQRWFAQEIPGAHNVIPPTWTVR